MSSQRAQGGGVSTVPATRSEAVDRSAVVAPGAGSLAEARAGRRGSSTMARSSTSPSWPSSSSGSSGGVGLADEFEQLQNTTRAALDDLQLLHDLLDEPAVDSRFVELIRDLVSELVAPATGVEADMVVQSWPEELPFHLSANLRRVAGEALSNVRRHSVCHVRHGHAPGSRRLPAVTGLADNGRGIVDTEGGFGLRDGRAPASSAAGSTRAVSGPARTRNHCSLHSPLRRNQVITTKPVRRPSPTSDPLPVRSRPPAGRGPAGDRRRRGP